MRSRGTERLGLGGKVLPFIFFPPLRALVGLDGEFVRLFDGFWGPGAVDCLVVGLLDGDWSDGGCLAVSWFFVVGWVWIFRGRFSDRALGSLGPLRPGFGWGIIQKRSVDFFEN